MKIEINESAPKLETSYPYFGISRGNRDLVMFVHRNYGLLIKEGRAADMGGSDVAITFWNEFDFSPFKGTLVIS